MNDCTCAQNGTDGKRIFPWWHLKIVKYFFGVMSWALIISHNEITFSMTIKLTCFKLMGNNFFSLRSIFFFSIFHNVNNKQCATTTTNTTTKTLTVRWSFEWWKFVGGYCFVAQIRWKIHHIVMVAHLNFICASTKMTWIMHVIMKECECQQYMKMSNNTRDDSSNASGITLNNRNHRTRRKREKKENKIIFFLFVCRCRLHDSNHNIGRESFSAQESKLEKWITKSMFTVHPFHHVICTVMYATLLRLNIIAWRHLCRVSYIKLNIANVFTLDALNFYKSSV